MYRERGVGGSKTEVGPVDRKRINEALDKQLERSSPSTSRAAGINGRDSKQTQAVLMGKAQPDQRDSRSASLSKTNCSDEEQNELIESAAEMLYGLIHARYILTGKGMNAMLDKYKNFDFGRCPRVYCCGQPCLPVGQSDIPRSTTVKIYCPRCEDVYYPRSKYQGNIDGAYFGTTFPHLFLMTYGHLKPTKASSQNYVPRVFGFKLHKP